VEHDGLVIGDLYRLITIEGVVGGCVSVAG